MASKNLKLLLKEAREAISNKEWQSALKLSKVYLILIVLLQFQNLMLDLFLEHT